MGAAAETAREDWGALEAEVDRFARQAIGPRVARPEAPLPPAALAELLAEAEALGLAGSDDAPSGLGPWEGLLAGQPPGLTLRLLARVGQASAAVGFVLHQRALGRELLRHRGLPRPPGPLAVAPQGWLGLGRTALPRWLAGAALSAEDRALLEDAYGPGARRVLPLDPGLGGLLVPTFAAGAFAWQLYPLEALRLEVEGQAHGLDELWTAGVQARAAPLGEAPAGAEDLARVLAAHQLGLTALALGAVEHALGLARTFAAQRRQGGATIDRHPAVLALLGRARAVLSTVRAQLEGLGAHPLALATVGEALACRAEALPALAEAAHAALQTLGGLGYMRDAGLEKVARDVNVLRALAGTPPELLLVVAEWERLHG